MASRVAYFATGVHSVAMALSIIVDFVKPLIRASMKDPEESRQAGREYLREREEAAEF